MIVKSPSVDDHATNKANQGPFVFFKEHAIGRDPITLSEDEQGVSNHLRNAKYLGSMKPFSEGDWIPRVSWESKGPTPPATPRFPQEIAALIKGLLIIIVIVV